ncbi:FimG family fimbrial adaptor subunit [Buttiauxella brennerae ATCC 51605]|jgi:minor fimbrial subunit|uniref:FimG family fimbrial adaptor subunit n=1 Tax=Buttiauxella brennerae ATCC 51605 TaxID=1354251 RepID=A0A1B7IQ23_9ENTR|nr:fimbrial protein [Buttiauxella brennerae]OAT31838.1 FimG family fimbrial adaptor subunit [Buttiauxella brennerae ATCC 51605]
MNSAKKVLPALVLATLFAGNIYAAADNIPIQISGRIIASPCTTVNNGISPLTVPLGDNIGAGTMQNAGANSDWVEFNIDLTNCPAGTINVKATFTGTPDTADNTRWLNMATTKAANTSVELKDKATNVMISNGSTLTAPVSSNKATFKLKTAAYTKLGAVTPGDISTTVLASFIYQ